MLEEIVKRQNENNRENPDQENHGVEVIFLTLAFYELDPLLLNDEELITTLQKKLKNKLKSWQEELETGVLGSQQDIIGIKGERGVAIQEGPPIPKTSVASFEGNALSRYPGSPSLSGH
jgi:hypothetical protein